MSCTGLTSFTLTAVIYASGDFLGFILAGVTLAPIFCIAVLCSFVAFRRDWQTTMLLVGTFLNVILNKALKEALREPRPATCAVMLNSGLATPGSFEEFGMPSNHAQFMAFLGVFASLFLAVRTTGASVLERIILGVLAHILILSVAYSRVYLGYHSLKQVLVGLGVGGCAGCAWFFIYLSILEPFGKVFTRTWIAQKLLIRDASSIGNIVKFEHNIYSLHTSYQSRFKQPFPLDIFDVPPDSLRKLIQEAKKKKKKK